ncbi:MAG TPA: AAA family ATPase [Solirubrobacteraceae bacterium]|nr:AAA family ATPase [Solirubrobacteraceae bacterium]
MSERVYVLVAMGHGTDPDVVEALVSGTDIDVAGYHDALDGSWAGSAIRTSNSVLVVCGTDGGESLELIGDAVAHAQGRPVVAVYPGGQNGYVGDIFGAGATDIVRIPSTCTPATARAVSSQVSFSLQKALARGAAPRSGSDGSASPMICVLGLKGGSGKTLTSVNLAAALAAAGNRVTIVDLDLQFGDVGLALGLQPERTLYDLVMSGGGLDAEKVAAFTVEHPSGVRALLAPVRPDQAAAVTPDFVKETLGLLRQVNDVVIVDTPPNFTPEVIAAIDCSSDVCMVAMLDALSLKNTKLGLETLERMGYERDRVRFVLNRADSRVGIGVDDVEAIVDRRPDVLVPSERGIALSVNQGEPVALARSRSEAGRAFHALAQVYAPQSGAEAHHNGKRRGGLFRRRATA